MDVGGGPLERAALLASIGDLLNGVRAGRGGALFVVGEAGLGKTTSVLQARVLAVPTVRVGLGSGNVMEMSLPFGMVTAALRAVGYDDLLAAPSLRAEGGDVRTAGFYRVLRCLEDSTAPVLLALDDLHWADPDSLALLSFLCRRLAGLPVAILGTLRPWPPGAYELASALVYDRHASMHRLAPLSEQAAASFLTARLGGQASDTVVRTAAALCAGNPLLLEQTAASLSRQGQEKVVTALDAVGAEGMVLARFAGLQPRALRVAQAASVLGTRFRPAMAAKMVNLPEWKVDAALSELYHSGLVREETETIAAFVHPLVGKSLYRNLSAPVRTRLHARAFKLLCAHRLEAEAVEHAIRADLVGDQAAIVVLERAGRSAMATGALGTAVKYLRAAANLAGDWPSPALQMMLGDTLLISGRLGEAIDSYERLCARADLPSADRVQALRMLGRALFATAAHDQATRRFAEAAAVARCDKAVAKVLLDDAIASWFTLGPAHSLPLATRACALATAAPDPLRRQAIVISGFVALLTGDPAGLAPGQAAAREIMSGSPEPSELSWSFGPIGTFAIAALFTERFADVEQALGAINDMASRAGAVEVTAAQLVTRAMLATRQGRLREALAAAEEAGALANLVPYCEGLAGYAKAEVLLQMDRLAECADWCDRIEATAADRGQSYILLNLWHVRARLLHFAGDHAGACLLYEQIEQLMTGIGIAEPCAVPWGRHALISYMASDRLEDSQRVIDWLERGAARLPCQYPRIAAATGQALLAEASGDPQVAERHYQAAMRLHQQVNLPMEHIETLMTYGSFLRRRGHRIRARAVLADAQAMADASQAYWLGKQVREEVAVAGGRRRRAVEKSTRLTAQEARIARLAGSGQSNKAIANQLNISAKTVEYHLGHVYAKLGISSRHQLVATLQRCKTRSS